VNRTTPDRYDVGQVTIDTLPDNVLLEIFDFYRGEDMVFSELGWRWRKLAHVCRRWRSVIFASPQRLELRVVCDGRTPTRKSLDIWPPFPIAVRYPQWFGYHAYRIIPTVDGHEEEELENVIAALGHHDRITHIHLIDRSGSALRRFFVVLLQPFVALKHLRLTLPSDERTALVLPETFLGGSAPRLRSFYLEGISFPSLPTFFVSSDLVYLSLQRIPTSGYISPEAMAAYLAPLSNLETLLIGFSSPRSRPNQLIPPPLALARIVLPALTRLSFRGVSEYLEHLISRIDTPTLDTVDIHFFMDLDFHIPQLNQFIARLERFKQPHRAKVFFGDKGIEINVVGQATLYLQIRCQRLDYQVSSVAQVCRELSPYLSFVGKLDMRPFIGVLPALQNDMDSAQWLEIFHSFIAVQSLRVRKELVPLVAPALQDLTGDRVTEVLPVLRYLHLEELEPSGSLWEAIQPFIKARQLSDHPVDIEVGKWDESDSEGEESEDGEVSMAAVVKMRTRTMTTADPTDGDEPHLEGNSPTWSTLTND